MPLPSFVIQPNKSLDWLAGSARNIPRNLGTLNGKIALVGSFRYPAVTKRLVIQIFRCTDSLNYAKSPRIAEHRHAISCTSARMPGGTGFNRSIQSLKFY